MGAIPIVVPCLAQITAAVRASVKEGHDDDGANHGQPSHGQDDQADGIAHGSPNHLQKDPQKNQGNK